MTMPKVSVIGLGYVGLCTALTFASKNFKVIGNDNDVEKAHKIEQGIAPFFETGIEQQICPGTLFQDFEKPKDPLYQYVSK